MNRFTDKDIIWSIVVLCGIAVFVLYIHFN